MPASDEQIAIDTDSDWIAFSSLERMESHWNRQGWWPGRRAYYWYLTFDAESALHEIAARCQAKLDGPYLDLVPLPDLHMTLERVAFEDEIKESDMIQVASAARTACREIAPFTIHIGPLAGSAGAISFSASPYADLAALRDVLAGATVPAISTASEPDGPRFRPHVGIAYCNNDVAAAPIVSTVRELRRLPITEVTVKAASLVELTREQKAYRWAELQSIVLGRS